ncbi:signal peptide, CUB and EGF-like domain-containing protein 2 [Rhopilema esculentum]|uniref:signal peptide, CUB and EGF-like domain-containing protein 2 n=1 Tax=Rhopilema esculentum TaxID=499914 RepID=UPI0031E31242|eukprot:gene545-10230_t
MGVRLVFAVLLGVTFQLTHGQVCNSPIGIGDPSIIADSAFSASSNDGKNLAHFARLNQLNTKAWCSSSSDSKKSITVKLPATYKVTGIAVQGLNGSGNGSYVMAYGLKYIHNGGIYDYLLQVVKGPTNKMEIARKSLSFDDIKAEAIILQPREYVPSNKACLRFEIYGCKVWTPTPRPTEPSTTPVDHCKANNGGCSDVCTSSPSGPVCSCNSGFYLDKDGKTCKAIPTTPQPTSPPDHCKQNNGGCAQTCTSRPSGPVCSCNSGFVLDKDNKTCNVNYCMTNNGGCEAVCKNAKSGPVCSCNDGYELKSDGKNCTNINECATKSDLCDDQTTNCIDLDGTYECDCKRGFKRSTRFSCEDINECREGGNNCNHLCVNIIGGFRCKCYNGYRLDRDGHTCNDINECVENNKCNTTVSTCENKVGHYICNCFSGLDQDPNDSNNCVDRNECDYSNGGCDHFCTNLYRSHKCSCRTGFHLGADNRKCVDNDECAVNNGGCNQRCINFDGKYRCDCRNGFTLGADLKTCEDVNECKHLNGGCEKYCTNTIGSFKCSCDPGFEAVNKICEDINECNTGKHNCEPATSDCYNTQGSFECRCKPGYKMNTTTNSCEAMLCRSPASTLNNGAVEPSRCLNYDSNKYTDVCRYSCNAGYKLPSTAASYVYCDNDGYFKLPFGKTSPVCQKTRCPKMSSIPNGYVYPSDCMTKGVEFGNKCHVACNGGYTRSGLTTVTCLKTGLYDNDFSSTKCVPRPKITCPSDITATLPLGEGIMKINVGKINTNVEAKYLKSFPSGVIDGSHDFKPGYHSVKLRASNELGDATECTFTVQVIDKEPPKVHNCDAENQYINIDSQEAVVTWKEPTFTDNAGISTKPQPSIPNGVVRRAQIYFVAYKARDDAGNTASCKFFVHVTAKYCHQNTMPGGHNIPQVLDMMGRFFLSCGAGNVFSDNTDYQGVFTIVDCANGKWTPQEIPSCVGSTAKQGDCPAGTQDVQHGQSAICANCPLGKYNNQTQARCQNCPLGYYQDEEGKTVCKKCPQGSTTIFQGSYALSQCKAQCDKGSYSKDGLTPLSGCKKCPIGSFQDFDGATYCKICPEGGETPGEGSSNEADCHVPARITKIVPISQEAAVKIGENVTIECSATGSPAPHLQITNATAIPSGSLRGKTSVIALPSASKYVAIRRLTITNAQVADSAVFKCVAQNPSISGKTIDERFIKVVVTAEAAS